MSRLTDILPKIRRHQDFDAEVAVNPPNELDGVIDLEVGVLLGGKGRGQHDGMLELLRVSVNLRMSPLDFRTQHRHSKAKSIHP